MLKELPLPVVLVALGLTSFHPAFSRTLEEGFARPPQEAKPQTWWHWMNGNVTKEGITADLEAMAEIGIGGAQIFDAGCEIPPGPVEYNTPIWFEMIKHAASEARRLGIELCLPNCSGWSSSGGPWNTPDKGMKFLVWTETKATGPAKFAGIVPQPENRHGFYEDIAILALPADRDARVPDLNKRNFRERGDIKPGDWGDPAKVVPTEGVIDLTERLKPDGTLDWQVPAGSWIVLRLGYAANGRHNHPASLKGVGLEVDKLSKSALDHHFDSYVARLCRHLGPLAGDVKSGLNNILVDSFEVASQNWTQGFEEEFRRRRGYAMRPYLVALAGHVVGSAEMTERFLWDFRRTVADLFAENYAGELAKKCHEYGLKLSLEPYGNCPSDDLQYGESDDIPMAEFWSQSGTLTRNVGNSALAASLGHVWGRRYIATESFTAWPGGGSGRWQKDPFSIKAQGDQVFAAGVNRVIYHRFAHQPWADDRYLPGMTMGQWGMHFDRTQTWWKEAKGWIGYEARCQYLLQEGRVVRDALFYCGENAPNGGGSVSLPYGYSGDTCARGAFLKLRAENGVAMAPGGVRYALVVLPSDPTMSPEVLCKVDALVSAGVKVLGPVRPVRTPGLKDYPSADAALKAEAARIWAKGVLTGSVAEALKALDASPDFACANGAKTGLAYIHRTYEKGLEGYFVALPNDVSTVIEPSFRVTGKVPELWDAETGRHAVAPVWREEGGRTVVRLELPPSGSMFVMFRPGKAGEHVTNVSVKVLERQAGSAPAHTLEILRAEYGYMPEDGKPMVRDITERLRARVKNGEICVQVGNDFAGGDPAFMKRKNVRIVYRYDGEEKTLLMEENGTFAEPSTGSRRDVPLAAYVRTDRQGTAGVWATDPIEAVLTYASGATKTVKADVPAPQAVEGPWQVDFSKGLGGPAAPVEFPSLVSWPLRDEEGVRYFSGTATYRKAVKAKVPADKLSRVWLDLGCVLNFACVRVNGIEKGVLWKPPFVVDVTREVRTAKGRLNLEIEVTNLWPNRMIGDEFKPDDSAWRKAEHGWAIKALPDWVKRGEKSPTGRLTFSTWKHWEKTDELLESGLLGPVLLRTVSAGN